MLAAREIDRSIGTRFFAIPSRLQWNLLANAAAQIAPTLKLPKLSDCPAAVRQVHNCWRPWLQSGAIWLHVVSPPVSADWQNAGR